MKHYTNDAKQTKYDFLDQCQVEMIQSFKIADSYFNFRNTFKLIQDIMFVPDEFAHNISKCAKFEEDFFYLSFQYPGKPYHNPMAIVQISQKHLVTTHCKTIISKN